MTVVRGKALLDPLERLLLHVEKTDGCWPWTGAKKPTGYGNFWIDGKHVGAHVASFVLHGGIIPEGYEVHYKCNNPPCVRPQHLEAVTPSKNILESNHRNKRKTHCDRGHEFTEVNTRHRKLNNGRTARVCRACHRKDRHEYA